MHPWLAPLRDHGFRLTVLLSGLFAIATLALFALVYWQTAAVETDRIDRILTETLGYVRQQPPDRVQPVIESLVMPDLRRVTYIALFDPGLTRIGGAWPAAPQGLPLDGHTHRLIARRGDGVVETIRAIGSRLPDGRVVMIGRNIDSLDNLRAAVMRALRLGLVPALLLSLLAGILVTRRSQRQVKRLHATLERIRHGAVHERLPVRGSGDDVDRLAVSVNAMLDEIARLMEEIKSTGDNIAHDLRTPLTRVRTRLERARDSSHSREQWQEVIDRATFGLDQALRLITALLRIGEIEAGHRRSAFAPLDLGELVAEIAEFYEPLAEEKGVTLRVTLAPSRTIRGDHDLLCELVANLVDNAVKFTPPGGEVRLSVTDPVDGPELRVADSGPGIAAEQRDAVFQRFTRSDASRGAEGYGLGLSLALAIATLHGFQLSLTDHRPGCVFLLRCQPIGA